MFRRRTRSLRRTRTLQKEANPEEKDLQRDPDPAHAASSMDGLPAEVAERAEVAEVASQ